MRGKNYWYGKEVEGRLYGLYTMFIRHEIGPITEKVKHLYFTIEFWENPEAVKILEEQIFKDLIVSIEVDEKVYSKVTPNIKVKAHLIYRFKDLNVFDLKETDSIFIDGNTFNVLCFTKHNALVVDYDKYSNDVE